MNVFIASGDAAEKQEAESLELAMRTILRFFADGRLVYRQDIRAAAPVARAVRRLRKLRRRRRDGSGYFVYVIA